MRYFSFFFDINNFDTIAIIIVFKILSEIIKKIARHAKIVLKKKPDELYYTLEKWNA